MTPQTASHSVVENGKKKKKVQCINASNQFQLVLLLVQFGSVPLVWQCFSVSEEDREERESGQNPYQEEEKQEEQ